MQIRGEAEAVIAMWREVERSLERAEPGSPEWERLTRDARLLRDEYQRLLLRTAAPPTEESPQTA